MSKTSIYCTTKRTTVDAKVLAVDAGVDVALNVVVVVVVAADDVIADDDDVAAVVVVFF